jgi:hypothetical protein
MSHFFQKKKNKRGRKNQCVLDNLPLHGASLYDNKLKLEKN